MEKVLSLALRVETALGLVAFLAALVAWGYLSQSARIVKLISTASEADRRILVKSALDILHVPTHRLDREEQYHLALEKIKAKHNRALMAFLCFSLVLASLVYLSVLAMRAERARDMDPKNAIRELLEKRHDETLVELRARDVYSLRDTQLAEALGRSTQLQPATTARPLAEQVQELRNLIQGQPVVSELRERAKLGQAPFQPIAEILRVGLPSIPSERPPRFVVHVPLSSPYRWGRIKIRSAKTDKELVLLAKPAIDDGARSVDLHLNGRQIEYLFGLSGLPESDREVLLVELVPAGLLYDPTCDKTASVRSRSTALCSLADDPNIDEVRKRL